MVTDISPMSPDTGHVGAEAGASGVLPIMSRRLHLRHRLPAHAVAVAALALSVGDVVQAQTAPPPAGRLLASNCFQCHGTNGKGPGFESIAGTSASELYGKLKEFQAGKEGDGIMARHALGYTDAQLRSLAQWLSTQR